MDAVKRLRIAGTPDIEDAFCYDALETGRVSLPGYEFELLRQPISFLNRAARHGEHDITAISSVVYSQVARCYAILSVGARVGRGHGPVLISRQPCILAELAGRPVGVGGIPTTGWFLLRSLCPEAVAIEMPSDRIAQAVAAGELEAGVMIHDKSLYYPPLELHRVADLGAEWYRRNRLPLPIDLRVIRRDLGTPAMQRICAALRRSLPRTADGDSLYLADDVRMGLRVLLAQAADMGFAETVPPLDIVEACEPIAAASLHAA